MRWAVLADVDGVDDLERWAADARAREAADARVRERWLRAQATEEASLAGVLLALAERRETVSLTTAAGRRHRGVLIGVGVDFVAIQVPAGTTTLVTLSGLAEARVVEDSPRPGSRSRSTARTPTTGDAVGRGAMDVRLGDVLAQAAGQRPRVAVQTGAASLVGELRAMGSDVLTVRTDGDAALVYVGLTSVSEVSFLASG